MTLRRAALSALIVLMSGGSILVGCGSGGVGGREIVIDSPVTITRAFNVGDVFKYKFNVQSQIGVEQTGFEQTITTQTELKTTSTVTNVTPEFVEVALRFDYAVGAMASGDAMLPDEGAAALRGKELELTLDPMGQFVSATGLANEAAFESGAGEFAMALSEVFPKLPDGPITIGTSWTEPVDVPDPNRDFVGDITYTVVGFKEKYEIRCAVLKMVTSFEFEGRATQGGDVWLMTGAGEGTGDILLSVDSGNIVYSSSETKLTLQAEGAAVASAAASGTVNMGVTTRSTVELM